jgi:hypothetical protein
MTEPVASEPLEHQPWAEAYQLAVMESDLTRLSSRIETAATAIAARIAELSELPNLASRAPELDSMNAALQVLRLLAEHAPSRKTMVL